MEQRNLCNTGDHVHNVMLSGHHGTIHIGAVSWKHHRDWLRDVLSIMPSENERILFLERYFKVSLKTPPSSMRAGK